ncbi:MAG: hypothetical protein J7L62_01965 [Candidatus Aminicenantes bacterium]|nr:hypothetical protein [Candidatus Aminicenantes bacterium]
MKIFNSERGPKPIGPYSQAVISGNLIFVSGQIPIDPATGNICGFSIEQQAERVFENIKAILEDAGSGLNRVVMVTVMMANLNEYQRMNNIYAKYFGEIPPARVVFQAARLPKDVKIEVSVIAELGGTEEA